MSRMIFLITQKDFKELLVNAIFYHREEKYVPLKNSRSCYETRYVVICTPEADFCPELMTRDLMLPKFAVFPLGGEFRCCQRQLCG